MVLMRAPVLARRKEWAYVGFAIDLASALTANLMVDAGQRLPRVVCSFERP